MEWNIKLTKLRQFWRYIFNVDNLIIVTFLPGKTLLIRAVANESKAHFIQIRFMFPQYIYENNDFDGEIEANPQ